MATNSLNIEEIKEKLVEKLKPSGWATILRGFIHSSHFDKILQTLWDTKQEGKRFTPPVKDIFRAFEECPYDKVKVIILGQDPYPQLGVADGIAFSCSNTEKMQPSLKFVLEAINKTVYPAEPYDYSDLDLKRWANQGVLLINTALTCEVGKPGTHYDIWQEFLVYLIDILSLAHSGLIWVFMGKKAQEFEELINPLAHHIITTSHPASAVYSGLNEWDSQNCFVRINEAIEKANGKEYKIKW